MKRNALPIIVAAVTIILFILIVVLTNSIMPRLTIENPSARVSSSSSIIQSIRPLAQLTSVQVQMAKADVLVEIRYGAANICNIWANHIAQGTNSAGINFDAIRPEDMRYDSETNTYYLTLPPAQITNCQLDPMQTQQYTSGGMTPLCPANTDEMRRIASYEALIGFRDDAIESGILERAQSESATVVSNFVTALTGSDVEITFRDVDATTFPATCMPDLPGGWRYNADESRWVR